MVSPEFAEGSNHRRILPACPSTGSGLTARALARLCNRPGLLAWGFIGGASLCVYCEPAQAGGQGMGALRSLCNFLPDFLIS